MIKHRIKIESGKSHFASAYTFTLIIENPAYNWRVQRLLIWPLINCLQAFIVPHVPDLNQVIRCHTYNLIVFIIYDNILVI